MADNQTPVGGETDQSKAPVAGLLAQYIKDLSFENPSAPASNQLMQNSKPTINLNVTVDRKKAGEDVWEVVLKLEATATAKDQNDTDVTCFAVDLTYAGLFGARNVPDQQLHPFLLIQGPNLLFPFARRIVADATRDGGFQPLMIEPINFEALFRQRLAQAQAEAGAAASNGAAEAPQPTELN